MFLSDDCPSTVGHKSQDHLQAKKMSIGPSDDLPPGFEDDHFQNQSKAKLSHIPQIKWECPSLVMKLEFFLKDVGSSYICFKIFPLFTFSFHVLYLYSVYMVGFNYIT